MVQSFVFLSFTGSVYMYSLKAAFIFKGSPNTTVCPTCDENLTCVWDQRCGLDEVCMVRSVSGRQFSTHCIRVRQHAVTVSIYYGYTSIYMMFIPRCMILYEVKGLFIHLFVANGATYFFYTSIYMIFLVKYVTIY